jgi:hypothetical protein
LTKKSSPLDIFIEISEVLGLLSYVGLNFNEFIVSFVVKNDCVSYGHKGQGQGQG